MVALESARDSCEEDATAAPVVDPPPGRRVASRQEKAMVLLVAVLTVLVAVSFLVTRGF